MFTFLMDRWRSWKWCKKILTCYLGGGIKCRSLLLLAVTLPGPVATPAGRGEVPTRPVARETKMSFVIANWDSLGSKILCLFLSILFTFVVFFILAVTDYLAMLVLLFSSFCLILFLL